MEQDAILHMRVSGELKARIDLLRKAEPDLPSRSEMVRRLVDRACERPRKRDVAKDVGGLK
jgi:hypothetical protein